MDEQTIFGAIATALIITITAGIISIPKRIKELKFKKENPEKNDKKTRNLGFSLSLIIFSLATVILFGG